MKGTVAVLIADGTPDSDGEVIRKDGIEVPDTEVMVTLEFNHTDFSSLVGKAKLYWKGPVLFADMELVDSRMKENGTKVLYPAFDGVCIERKGHVVFKSAIRGVGLCIGRNSDLRIGTLYDQGVR